MDRQFLEVRTITKKIKRMKTIVLNQNKKKTVFSIKYRIKIRTQSSAQDRKEA
jgi:hypothetical protein